MIEEKYVIIASIVSTVTLVLVSFTAYFINKYFKCITCKRRAFRGCLRKCNPCLSLSYRHSTYDQPLPKYGSSSSSKNKVKRHTENNTHDNNNNNTNPISVVVHDGITVYPTPTYIPPSMPVGYAPTFPQPLPNSHTVLPSHLQSPYTTTLTTNGGTTTTTTTTIVNPFPDIPSNVIRPNMMTTTTNPLYYPVVPSYYIPSYDAPPNYGIPHYYAPSSAGTVLSPLPEDSIYRLPSLPVIDQPGKGIIPTITISPTTPSPMNLVPPSPLSSSNPSTPLHTQTTAREQQRFIRRQIEQTIPIELNEVYRYPVEQGKQWYKKKIDHQAIVNKNYRRIDRQYEERLIVMALLRSRWASMTTQELADYVRRIPGLTVPYNPQERITASTAKEALWEALVRWSEDRSSLPPNVVPVLTRSFEQHSTDILAALCTYYDLPISGRPLDLWDRLESYFYLTPTRPEPSLTLRTRPVYARYSKRLHEPWWLREGYSGEEAMPIELAVDGTSIYHHSFWLYQDGAIQESSDRLEHWFPVLDKAKHREWQGNEGDTNALRRKLCGSLLVRSKCWDEIDSNKDTLLFRQYIQQTIGTMYRTELPNHFRADDHGNIVSDIAGNNSIARFDPDHGFPWSRGGLTVVENLRALHFAANRWGKKHALIIAEPNMKRGIHSKDFVELYIAARKWCEAQPTNSNVLRDLSNPKRNHGHVKKNQQQHEANIEPVTTVDINIATWALVTKLLCRTLEDKQVISNWNEYRHQYPYNAEGWKKVLLDLANRIKDE